MLRHPDFAELLQYDEQNGADAVTARHVAGCRHCRAQLDFIRRTRALARQESVADVVPDVLQAVQARRARGDRVVVPAVAAPARRSGRMVIGAAAAVVLMIGVAVLRGPAPLTGSSGGLQFSPAEPRAGARVEVEYRPSPELANAGVLRLRGRFRTPDAQEFDRRLRQQTVATLTRQADGSYRGSFDLPPDAVFAAFAVEDSSGSRVDSRMSRLWDLLVHDDAGRPTLDALIQYRADLHERDWVAAADVARRLTEEHPDNPVGWAVLHYYETQVPGERTRAEITASHKPRFEALHELHASRPGSLSPLHLGHMHAYAMYVATQQAFWRDRLITDYPLDPIAVHYRAWRIEGALRPDTTRMLAAFDTLYRAVGPVVDEPASRVVWLLAGRPADEQLMWLRRAELADPGQALSWINFALNNLAAPEVQAYARDRARALLRADAFMNDSTRPLASTRDEHARAVHQRHAFLLAGLGRSLLAAGSREAAIDTLRRAADVSWDSRLHRSLAGAYLQAADTAGAVQMWARIAADPTTAAAFADSVPGMAGSHFRSTAWEQQLVDARSVLRTRTMERASRQLLPKHPIRLMADDGSVRDIRALLGDGTPTFIAVWSRWCGPSNEQLPELDRLAAQLAGQGFRVITITAEPFSDSLREFLARRSLTMPVYSDVRGDATQVLQQYATPAYYLLDGSGVVRFNRTTLERIPAEAMVLLGGE